MRYVLVKKPSHKHLKDFGCDVYVHVPRKNRNKLDNKDEKGIFIGYKGSIKGYIPWKLVIKKIVYNWDVVFREVNIATK
jgi:hypothetical protein